MLLVKRLLIVIAGISLLPLALCLISMIILSPEAELFGWTYYQSYSIVGALGSLAVFVLALLTAVGIAIWKETQETAKHTRDRQP